tara:strand:- start:18580 stop:19524 length:945 start_codon:yes stop_codon:yes gene_type:complete
MPPAIRQPLDGFAVGVMLGLCMIWGLQQVAIKAAAPDLSPVLQIGLRSLMAAGLVAGVMVWRRQKVTFSDGTLIPGLLAGLLFAAEFLFVAWGLDHTTASHMVVFLYTAPVFTALGLHVFVPGERLGLMQAGGVLLAFLGLAVTFSGGFAKGSGIEKNILLGDALGVLAGLCWGATTVLIRATSLSEARPTMTLLYQLLVAAVVLCFVGLVQGDFLTLRMTGLAWASLLYQGVIVSFGAFLTWFWLLRRYLAGRLAVLTFLSPLFGVAFGVVLLGETLEKEFMAGAVLVFGGIILVNMKVAAQKLPPGPKVNRE